MYGVLVAAAVAPVVTAANAASDADSVDVADAVAVAAVQSEPRLLKICGESPVQLLLILASSSLPPQKLSHIAHVADAVGDADAADHPAVIVSRANTHKCITSAVRNECWHKPNKCCYLAGPTCRTATRHHSHHRHHRRQTYLDVDIVGVGFCHDGIGSESMHLLCQIPHRMWSQKGLRGNLE